jgi:type IV secretory pathway TraG/TraD family ATPase VirD4
MPKPRNPSNDTDIFLHLILGVIFLVLFPIIPITLIFTAILYIYRQKGNLVFIFGMIGIFALSIYLPNTITLFLKDISIGIQKAFAYISENQHIEIIGLWFNLSFSSWIVLSFISLTISGYLLYSINKSEKLIHAGVNTFDGSIGAMSENRNNPKSQWISNTKTDTKEKTLLGKTQGRKPIYCDDNAKHIFVCGTTGSGKTVALANFIKSGVEKGYGLLIIDGKGDIDSGSMLEITKHFAQKHHTKLYIINLNNPETSDKYNPFAGAKETIAKDMLINMTDWSEEHYKTNTERYIQKLLKLLTLKQEKLSYKSIIENISTSAFEELSVTLAKENKITKQDHLSNLDLIKASGKIAENAAARFATIAESDIGTIFDENGIDITTALKENAVILFILNPLIYPELSPVMGRLILIDAKKAVSKMFGDGRRKFFIFDEINVYASTVLIDLVNKSRSAGVTAIPATQSLADLEAAAGEAFREQIIENCNNYLVMRQNSPKSAEEWAKTIGTQEKMQITYQISNSQSTNVGTARKTREFIVHPDDIKKLQTGEGYFLSKDNGRCEKIKVQKPF